MNDGARGRRSGLVGLTTAVLKGITATCIAGIMVLTTADVIGRYLLASPVDGAYEISQFLLALATFSTFPLVSGDERHIDIGLLESLGSVQLGRIRRLAVLAISALVVGCLTFYLFKLGTVLDADRQTLGAIDLPLWPLGYALSAFSLLAFCALVLRFAAVVTGTGAESGARQK